MDTETYPNEKVARVLNESFVPLKLVLSEIPQLAKKFNVAWTPTFLVVDSAEAVHSRSVGWLPPDEFKAELDVALGLAFFQTGNYGEAKARFDHVIQHHPKALSAADALYWYGVADYRATGQKETLLKSWNRIIDLHPNHPWATKVSFLRRKA